VEGAKVQDQNRKNENLKIVFDAHLREKWINWRKTKIKISSAYGLCAIQYAA